ncbi:MAG: tetratricopeptide repeat protein [Desulfobacterales bacterium]|jgi:tetratricopeptide (TPR) repeat protein
MILPLRFITAAILSGLLWTGCANLQSAPASAWHADPEILTEYRENAAAFESEGDLEAALLTWRIIGSLDPEDPDFSASIDRLKNQIVLQSERHYKQGVLAFESGDSAAALRQFLTALRINSEHAQALSYLYRIAEEPRYDDHVVGSTETLKSMAQRYYGDGKKAVLIARFNDLDPSVQPTPGSLLRIPRLELPTPETPPRAPKPRRIPTPPKPPKKTAIADDLENARRLFESGSYEAAAEAAGQLLESSPEDTDAAWIYNASLFEEAKRLRFQKRYPEAMSLFKKVDARWPGLKSSMDSLETVMNGMAEEFYRLGVKYFIDEELELAIQEWEKVLAYNPDHSKAASSIKEAKELLRALKKKQSAAPAP